MKTTPRLVPAPKYLAACRQILGDDTPATVIGAIRNGDPRMALVQALAVRDPKRWFCSAVDESSTPRAWAKGDTKEEARTLCEGAVDNYRGSKARYRRLEPRNTWHFDLFPPATPASSSADGKEGRLAS